MSMLGRINTTFGTYQADLFESGLVAQIGPNSCAVDAHAEILGKPSQKFRLLVFGHRYIFGCMPLKRP